MRSFLILWLVAIYLAAGKIDSEAHNEEEELPTVMVAILVRNKEHTLPLFLNYLSRVDYPKSRMSLWIRSDHNSDDSIRILEMWLENVADAYNSVDVAFDKTSAKHENETSAFDWPHARFNHIISLKEKALKAARKLWAQYIFFLDADVFLTDVKTLTHLTQLHLPVVAPLLLSEGLYSNFWCGMTSEFYYERTDEYKEIYDYNKEGTFQVKMIHSAVLINLNYVGARLLTFDRSRLQQNIKESPPSQCVNYDGPLDDIIIFAISANCSQIPLYINNEKPYGYILQPLDTNDNVSADVQQLVNIKVNIVHEHDEVAPLADYFKDFSNYPQKHKLTLDKIYMINLKRRPNRRLKMENLFKELGLDVETFIAIDGKELSTETITEMGIKILPDYEDPYHHRKMTMGEIGCFLSHYRIWEKIVENGQEEVLILEDDIRFEPYFKERAESVLQQIRSVSEYDLIYFGRKRLKDEKEPWVRDTENVVHVGYSYWTLGYVITLKGAKKLLAANPLTKMIPVDEFLPVMFDRHPNNTWNAAFPKRNLLAFSAAPLLLYPTLYTGELGYISDTEDSIITSNNRAYSNIPTKGDRERDDFGIDDSTNNMGLSTISDASKAGNLLKHDIDIDKTQHGEL